MKRIRIPPAFAVMLGALVAFTAACGDDDDITGPDFEVESVELTADADELEIGSTSQLELEILDAQGNPIDPEDVNVVFTSSSEGTATVSESGLITPVAAGNVTITVNVEGVTDTVTLAVINEITSIAIQNPDLDLVTDENQSLDLIVLNAQGVPTVNPALHFTSSNPAVVSVDEEGELTAQGAGTATVTVTGGGATDTINIEVFANASGGLTAAGSTFSILPEDEFDITDLVVVRDPTGAIIPDAELAFQTLTQGIVDVDAAGLLTPVAPGNTLITATSPDATGSATFRVSVLESGAIDVFQFAPGTTTITVGGTTDLGLNVLSDGTPITNLLSTFTSSDETIATVDPFTGVVTGLAAGTTTITATTGTLTTDVDITVQ